jgi:hypothetical protein
MLPNFFANHLSDTPGDFAASVNPVLRNILVDILGSREIQPEDVAAPCAPEFLFEPAGQFMAYVDSSIVFVEIVSHDVTVHKCLANEFQGSDIAILYLAKNRTDDEHTGR